MNILYGVNGQGFGHSAHAQTIIPKLQKNHTVHILAHDQSTEFLKELAPLTKIHGLKMIYNESTIHYRTTILHLFKTLIQNIIQRTQLQTLMETIKPNLIISDMEPISAFLAYYHNKPIISMSLTNRFTRYETKTEKKQKDRFFAKTVITAVTQNADWYLAPSFTPLQQIKPNSTLTAPIIRPAIQNLKTKESNHVLVYLTAPNPKVIQQLEQLPESFIIYGYHQNQKDKNLQYKTPETFLTDLANCKAIIGTAGFSLISEALYLKKPYFAVPLAKQYEQYYNAHTIKKEKLGTFSEQPTKKEIKAFLEQLPAYKRNLANYNPAFNDIHEKLSDTIARVVHQNI